MGPSKKKNYKLSIYLIREDYKSFADALDDARTVEEYKIKGTLKWKGAIFVGQTKKSKASWVQLLQQGTDKPIRELNNSSNRAVLFLKSENRLFALPFGFGKYLLKAVAIESEFGLKTALNIIDADKLRSVDKANVDNFTVLTTTQTSRKAKPQEFNLDIIRDLLRGVTGEPFPDFETLGSVVTGNEGINIVPALNFEDILPLLSQVGKAYKSRRYKASFDWVDNVKYEHDEETKEKLEEKLIHDLKSKDRNAVHLTAPVLIDWENYEGFSFTPKAELRVDLDISAYYEEKKSVLSTLTWEKLKSQRLYVKYGDREDKIATPLLKSLNYETSLEGQFFVFAFGEWFQINKSYSKKTLEYVRKVKESKLEFIECDKSWVEETYNKKLASSNANYFLLDQKFIKSDAFHSKFEACDVFDKANKEFVHVKFKSGSATLSHLFNQGRVSCNLLVGDIVFRKNLRKLFKDIGLPVNIIPEKEDSVDTSKYTVTFAIISDGSKDFVDSLPFFSLLSFRLTVAELNRLGFKVRIKKIKYV
jgi:uncharacterized protein (TIGR04141 family)